MKPIVYVSGIKGNWKANFTIGVQTFTVCERERKTEANWYCKMLRKAFSNLGNNKFSPEHIDFSKKDKTRWISVEEYRPEEYQTVLLYESKFGTIVYGFWNGEDFYQTFAGLHYDVTHWQPLPSPPKQ